METIIRKQKERERIGKNSIFRVRGQPVPAEKIRRYKIRKEVKDDDTTSTGSCKSLSFLLEAFYGTCC